MFHVVYHVFYCPVFLIKFYKLFGQKFDIFLYFFLTSLLLKNCNFLKFFNDDSLFFSIFLGDFL